MGELSPENFYAKIATAPRAVQGFFETVIEHFNKRNDIHAHHTDTNGGDLRLALPAELARHHTIRNFATLHWQSRNQEIFVRSYLTPDEMAVLNFVGVKKLSFLRKYSKAQLSNTLKHESGNWLHSFRLVVNAINI